MEAAAPLECKKDGLKQMQSGEWTLVLKVHPNDMPPWLLTAPMGQRLAVVVAALKDEAEKPKERKRFDEIPYSQQAALRCQDEAFHKWLIAQKYAPNRGETLSDFAAAVIREHCDVKSRAELDSNLGAAARWRDLNLRFLTETGRVTEQR